MATTDASRSKSRESDGGVPLGAIRKIRLGYPKSKMNRLQRKGDFGKILVSVEG